MLVPTRNGKVGKNGSTVNESMQLNKQQHQAVALRQLNLLDYGNPQLTAVTLGLEPKG
jgi:hypothetical protein